MDFKFLKFLNFRTKLGTLNAIKKSNYYFNEWYQVEYLNDQGKF